MIKQPDNFPIAPETYRALHRTVGKIALQGEALTVEDDESWITRADFPTTLGDKMVIGMKGYRYMPYTTTSRLDLAARVYGESVGALDGTIFPVGHLHVDLTETKNDHPIIGFDYVLLSGSRLQRSARQFQDITPAHEPDLDELLTELGIDRKSISQDWSEAVEVEDAEGRQLVRLAQTALREGSAEW